MNLKSPALLLYFCSYLLYLFFFRLHIDKEMALVFKPMIVASIFFFYFFSNHSKKKNVLHYLILALLFVADNVNLLMETVFYQMALGLYLIILFILLFLILNDSKLIKRGSKVDRYLTVGLVVGAIVFLVMKIVSIYIVKYKFHSYYFILNYIVVFLSVLLFSFYNYFKHKTLSSKYLMLTLLSLFLSDLFYVVNKYYIPHEIFVIIACILEIPSYYFLVHYLINRDEEKINLENNISS